VCILWTVVFVIIIITNILFLLFDILFLNSGHDDTGMTNVEPNSTVKLEEKSVGKGRIILK